MGGSYNSIFLRRYRPVIKTAVVSKCTAYRYELRRQWDTREPVVFLMLNPSTADSDMDDATIRRCVGFAKRWGCGGLIVVNLFAYRTTDPTRLTPVQDPVGPENDRHIVKAILGQKIRNVVCAWGTNGGYKDRDEIVTELIAPLAPVRCFQELTKAGFPRHPLYVPYGTPLLPFFGRGNLVG